jgi:quinoprotein dehydrogenase-associated probable ABC transporter substrate-binding protein
MFLPCLKIWQPTSAKEECCATAAFSLALLVLPVISLSSCERKGQAKPVRQLRVCADPNNLPFSNQQLEGFENKIAGLIASELNANVEYTWWPQRRGFIRNTLKAGSCDLVLGVPRSFELALTTSPYYRSTYVFVYRKGKGIRVRSLDDPVLRRVKIGVQMVGDDFANTPPAHALANRKIIHNVKGYTLYGDYAQPNPPARIVDAVAAGEVDVAIVWGPLAGYFVKRQSVPLEIVPVSPQVDLPFLPFVYDISMGVRRGDERLKVELEKILEQKRPEIESIPSASDCGSITCSQRPSRSSGRASSRRPA